MAVALKTIEAILELHQQGQRTSQIAAQLKIVSEQTVKAVCTRPDHYLTKAMERHREEVTDLDMIREKADYERCPGCGGKVKMPCAKCIASNYRRSKARHDHLT